MPFTAFRLAADLARGKDAAFDRFVGDARRRLLCPTGLVEDATRSVSAHLLQSREQVLGPGGFASQVLFEAGHDAGRVVRPLDLKEHTSLLELLRERELFVLR